MIEPRDSITRFVRAVASAELARGSPPGLELAQRLLTCLHHDLGKLIGSHAFDVLLGRSVVLARRAYPVLAAVASIPEAKLTVLGSASATDDSLGEGALAIVSHFIELLAVLIGEDLAMRLVHDVWPAVMEEERR